ncbi:MAG TPA: hypothetical protein DIU15_00220 [Deltaproteobacteria bacterium]|nr:hypothetical protein [Deltaproteobacteria bacterium]HCP44452.1 hypothetical protein [Deltaproteobacteria bacterium]
MSTRATQSLLLAGSTVLAILCSGCEPGQGITTGPAGQEDESGSETRSAVVVTSDYTDTLLARVGVDSLEVTDQLVAYAEGDVRVFAQDEDVFVVSRTGADVVRRFDGNTIAEGPTLEFSTGAGSNPHTIKVCRDRLFVSLYDESAISIREPINGVEVGRVDLTQYDEGSDGSCEPSSMVLYEDTLLVALERFNLQTLEGDPVGWVVQVDCETGDVIDSWQTARNPSIQADPSEEGRLLVREGDFFQLDGAVRVLDIPSGSWIQTLVTEADLQRDITGVAANDGQLVVVAWDYAATPQTFDILCLDRTTGSWLDGPSGLPQNIWTVRTAPDGRVWIAALPPYDDPAAEHGILVLDPTSCELSNNGAWVPFSLPATDMAFP